MALLIEHPQMWGQVTRTVTAEALAEPLHSRYGVSDTSSQGVVPRVIRSLESDDERDESISSPNPIRLFSPGSSLESDHIFSREDTPFSEDRVGKPDLSHSVAEDDSRLMTPDSPMLDNGCIKGHEVRHGDIDQLTISFWHAK